MKKFQQFIDPEKKKILRRLNNFFLNENKKFKIIKKIPRFVEIDSYCDRFGFQWKKWGRIHYDSYTKIPLSKNELEMTLGKNLKTLKGKYVLEAGCGGGRFTEVLVNNKAIVDSFDYSTAVEANYKFNGKKKNLRVFQADILNLPLKNDTYDYVICLHVVQHTPNPTQSIKELYSKVKPGGTLIFDQYKFKFFKSLPTPIGGGGVVYRWLWKLLPKDMQSRLAIKVVNFFWPIHWKFKDSKIVQFILFRIAPIRFYYPWLPLKTKKQHFEWSMSDTHDGLCDVYKYYGWKSSIIKLLKELEAVNIKVWYGGNGVVARCEKPNSYKIKKNE
jgi:2-polyprenyl-3-methyl-5-hydroxy-6-metoxy-1,4-benzoquinol methylase